MSKFESSSHGSTMYSSSHVYSFPSWICLVLVCSHDEETFGHESKVLMYSDAWLMMISNQENSLLEVITFAFKALAYHIPLASCFGGNFVTHKSHHHHVIRSKTSIIAMNPKLWSENTGPRFSIAYKNPALLLPLRQEALPCSVMLTASWQ